MQNQCLDQNFSEMFMKSPFALLFFSLGSHYLIKGEGMLNVRT